MRDIAKNIKQLRVSKNMTQDELSEKLFVTRQTVSNYETGKSRPDVDMLVKIAEVLGTDINALIYGPTPDEKKTERKPLIISTAMTALFALLYYFLLPIARTYASNSFNTGWYLGTQWLLGPLFLLFAGWTLMHLTGMAMKWKPLQEDWVRWIALVLAVLLTLWFFLTLWTVIAVTVNGYLYENHIRGEWIEVTNEINNTKDLAWSMLPPPIPEWVNRLVGWVSYHITEKNSYVYPLLGAALWLPGKPKQKEA